jgi:signal transduction histidine kinase
LSSDPTSPEAAARPPRRSAFLGLAAIYAFAFVLCALLFVAVASQIVRAKNAERVEALVAADREAVLDKIGGGPADLKVAKATAIVLARSARPDEARLYRLDRGGQVLVGNIPQAARLSARNGGRWFRLELPGDGRRRGLAVREPLGGGAVLYVGRALEDPSGDLVLIVGGALLFAALSGFVVAPWAGRRILRRVNAINEACDKVRVGDLSARAPGADSGDEFGALAGHVNAMLGRISALVTGLRDVSNRIAHDLRTPMARLKSDLEKAARAETLEEARALAGAAAVETDEILQTFEALLDIAEVEAGSDGELSPMRLDEAAAAAVDLYEAVAEDRGISLVFDRAPAPILGERSLIVRLAANLLDNAIKFSPPDGTVRVTVRTDGDECLISVEDPGPGVPAAEREVVMGRFARGSAAAATPGHGLGLALVAAVAKRHGAVVKLEEANPGLKVTARFRAFQA